MLRASFLPASFDLIPDKSIQQSKVGWPLFNSFASKAQYLLLSNLLLLSFLFYSLNLLIRTLPPRKLLTFSHHKQSTLSQAVSSYTTFHTSNLCLPLATSWKHLLQRIWRKKSPADKSSPPLHLSSLKTFHGPSLLRASGFSQPLQHKAHFSCVMGSSIKYEPGGAIIQLGAMAAMERRKNTSQRCDSMKREKIKKKRSDVKLLHPLLCHSDKRWI